MKHEQPEQSMIALPEKAPVRLRVVVQLRVKKPKKQKGYRYNEIKKSAFLIDSQSKEPQDLREIISGIHSALHEYVTHGNKPKP